MLKEPKVGVVKAILPAEKADWSALVNVNVKVVPLSSSPEPENVIPELRPIGLPLVPVLDDHVAVAPPSTCNSPALAEVTAKDPHKADKPNFLNLFILLCLL
jgi:hypothetical protein